MNNKLHVVNWTAIQPYCLFSDSAGLADYSDDSGELHRSINSVTTHLASSLEIWQF